MYSIGDFSMASGIPVRTLRFYHEVGLLVPAAIDPQTNYRLYDEHNLDRAKVIVALRQLEFTLEQIAEILAECHDDADLLEQLERQRQSLGKKIQHYSAMLSTINQLIDREREAKADNMGSPANSTIEERDLDRMLVAGIRMKGYYSECGKAFGTLGKKLWRHFSGKPLCLFFDGEYREGDANFEACVPVRGEVDSPGILVHELPAARVVTLLHHGPYENLKSSYAKLFKYVNERGYNVALPTREVYLKGPGMIFRGNPKKYLTEIQIPIEAKK